MTTYAEMKAAWTDDRAPLHCDCEHEWVALQRQNGSSTFVACAKCERRPHCAPSLFDSRQRSNRTHSQGETEAMARGKARLCAALGDSSAQAYQCKHCGFWSIR